MKKYVIALLVLVLVLCAGCAKQEPAPAGSASAPTETAAPAETTMPPATEETVPGPKLTTGSALADKTPAILDTLLRDNVVDVVGEYDEGHYVIKTERGYGLVCKELLRLEGEAAYQVWTGYALYHAEVYGNFHLLGEPEQQLNLNTRVEVLDDLGYCYVIRLEEKIGYMKKTQLAKGQISSGGSGGSTGADGGDISLQSQSGVVLLAAIEQKGEITGQAVVLADETEVILGYFERGEGIPIVAEDGFADKREGFVTVYLKGLYAYVPQSLVLTEDAEEYEAWDGYSRWDGMVYDNFYLLGDPIDKLYTNVQVHVIAELENCYLVEVNGLTGFMSKEMVSRNRISTGGSSSSGGGASGGEWSPPAL